MMKLSAISYPTDSTVLRCFRECKRGQLSITELVFTLGLSYDEVKAKLLDMVDRDLVVPLKNGQFKLNLAVIPQDAHD